MSIRDHLLADEEVKEKHENYYLTGNRLIKHSSSLTGEKMDDLSLSQITSISLKSKINMLLLILGIILLIAYGLGLILIVLAFVFKKSFFQIRVAGLSENEEEKWRIGNAKSEKAKSFAKEIRRQMRE